MILKVANAVDNEVAMKSEERGGGQDLILDVI